LIRGAHLLPTMEIGGRERIVADLCRTAPGLGIEPVLITYDVAPPSSTLIDAPGVPVIALDRRDSGFRAQVGACLKRERIDVLHAQGHISAALVAGVGRDVPMVVTIHVALGSGWRWLLPIVRGLRAADVLTAVSDDLARRFGRLAGRRIETIPTGVDLERFRPAERQAGSPFTIGIAARLHPVKRHRDALAAMRILAARGLQCRLLIAGEGDCRPEIEASAKGLDVEMLGAVEDMPAFLHRLDAFLLPSDHEGTPAALLEAMACGLPCIATQVGGMPALLGNAGLLVPRRDPEAIARAIARLIESPDERRRLGRHAADHASKHGSERQARRYAGLYEQLLSARGGRPAQLPAATPA
jgi:glycosyltransferase involved in cell wall biosynthesis